jgi:TonB-linked SusC/RagA family outer membrane protein|tara:strand:+ start:11689 stop:14862 length:3174 start_codon:yes stop_codon:yes gene_type:complete
MIIEIISSKVRELAGSHFRINLSILFYMTALFQLEAGPITILETPVDWGINAPRTSEGLIPREALFSIVPGMKGDLTQYTITGMVTDNQGNSLPGANILEKGTINGVQTDFDGNFSLQVADENTILVVSYLGFKTQEIASQGKAELNIILEEDAAGLDEVVVVGYGTQKKSDLTGAITSVTSEEIQSLTTADPTAALQGRAAGVNVQSSGSPGGGVNVVIRGAATINGSVAPLYVIDGIFRESLDAVNANDIASIQILKDASAAAIYGSRAANGVIIVTTNKGSSDGLTIEAHSTLGMSNATNTLDFMNARQYADARNAIADSQNTERAPANSTDFDPNIDTDWQDLQLRTGVIQDYGFNVAGGGKNSSVYFSANYFDEKGILISSGFNKANVRLNSEYWSNNKKIKLSQTLGLTQRNFDRNNFYGSSGYNIPTIPVRDNTGNFVAPNSQDHGIVFNSNRYAQALTYDDQNRIDEVFGSVSGEVELLPGFKYKLNLGLNFWSNYNYQFVPTFFWSTSNPSANTNETADLSEARSTYYDTLMDNVFSYDKEFGKNTLGLVLGNTLQKISRRGTSVQVSDFPSNDLRVVSAGIEVINRSGQEFVTGLESYYFRLTYNYDDRYLLTSTVRQDKSSKFAEDYRTGIFPSISLGWRLSKEKFFPQNNVLTDLKLRASYGELGSQNLDDYAFFSVMNLNSNYDFADTRFFGVSRTQFNLENLVWETSKTTNFGLDASLFNGRLRATADYFIRNTQDILVSLPIPPTSGSGAPITTNAASIKNKGFELGLDYNKAEGEFTYGVNFNISAIQNEVTSLGPLRAPILAGVFSANAHNSTVAIKGEEMGAFWGFETEGLYQSQADIENDPNLANDAATRSLLRPGDLIWKDQNGDGIVNEDDRVNIGSPYPDFEYGLNFNANYKNFELTLFFQGQVGNEILNARKFYTHFEVSRSNYATSALDAWTPTNTDTNIPRLGTSRTATSDWYVEEGGYLRLKQLRLAYTFNNLFKVIPRIQVFANAQNLLTFTNYSGYDPELGTSLFDRGVDNSVYPQIVQIMGGLKFTIK